MSVLSDPTNAVIESACAGDEVSRSALAQWLLRAARAMVSIRLHRVVARRSEIDDIVQQVVSGVFEVLPDLRSTSVVSLRALTSRIVERRVTDLMRRSRQVAGQLPDDTLDSIADGGGLLLGSFGSERTPSSHAHRNELLERLLTIVDDLEENERRLLILIFWDGLGTTEAADRLGRGRTAVANHVRRVLDKLISDWKRRYGPT
jgi:RNA polymerase sigma factor (sigma-70 family)